MYREARSLYRLAAALHARWSSHPAAPHLPLPPHYSWQQVLAVARRLDKARRHGWHRCGERLKRTLAVRLRELRDELLVVERQLQQVAQPRATTVRDLYLDLVELQQEFAAVEFDHRAKSISVTTEPIALEGVYLGPFAIRLDWSDLADGHPGNYQVIALDPQPAASNQGVTHPHVQDEAVCEGDGRLAIRQAQQQGRLFDFFMLVANLLRTYNPGSPYIALRSWHGIECSDCAAVVDEGDQWSCERCETNVCGDCNSTCPDCDGVFCHECVTNCEGCGNSCCDSCIQQCLACEQSFCQDCLIDQERCERCHDKHEHPRIPEPIPIERIHEASTPRA